MQERLQKILARAGVASRRKAEEMIQQGRVTVNGIPLNEDYLYPGNAPSEAKFDIASDNGTTSGFEYFFIFKPLTIKVFSMASRVGEFRGSTMRP